MSFQNRTRIALVTGATRGIGRETVRQLASQGVQVLLAGRDPVRTVDAASTLQGEGLPVDAVTLDVTSMESIAAAAEEVERRYGRLDILVNNAGIFLDDMERSPSGQSLGVWRDTFETNLFGVIATTQAFLPLLKKSPDARIVNVSSELAVLSWQNDPAWRFADFRPTAYSASKTALNAWTLHLAHELRDTNIRVNAVCPGSVRTDMNTGGDLSIEVGALSAVSVALQDDAPHASFTRREEVLPW